MRKLIRLCFAVQHLRRPGVRPLQLTGGSAACAALCLGHAREPLLLAGLHHVLNELRG